MRHSGSCPMAKYWQRLHAVAIKENLAFTTAWSKLVT
jgi:hypothetical protein